MRLHYGRYHDALLGGTFYHMDTSQQHPKITALVLGPNEFEEIDRVDVANNVGVDSDVKPSYVDQYIAGIEHELMPDLSVQVQYIRRNYKDFMGFVDTGATYDPVQRRDPGPDNTLDTADDGELLTVYNKSGDTFLNMTNPEGAFRRYNGFQVNVRKRFSHNWQTNTSYTWSRTRGNVNNNFGANAPGAARRAISASQARSRTPTGRSTTRAPLSSTTRITSRPRAPIGFRSGAGSTSAACTATSPARRGDVVRRSGISIRAASPSGLNHAARDGSTP